MNWDTRGTQWDVPILTTDQAIATEMGKVEAVIFPHSGVVTWSESYGVTWCSINDWRGIVPQSRKFLWAYTFSSRRVEL